MDDNTPIAEPEEPLDSSPLSVRATITLRHEALVGRRKKLGMSQRELAEQSGVPMSALMRMESLDFSHVDVMNHAHSLATALDLNIEDVVPDGWAGTRSESRHSRTFSATKNLLPSTASRLEAVSPIEAASTGELKEKVDKVMRTLRCRDREVLRLLYGIGTPDGKTMTLEECAKKFNVNRERLRQIKVRAMQAIRSPCRVRVLSGFVPDDALKFDDREKSESTEGR